MKLLIFVGILQDKKFEFLKFKILEILNFTHGTVCGINRRSESSLVLSDLLFV